MPLEAHLYSHICFIATPSCSNQSHVRCYRFYVGCDMCSNWYHGSCVGISQRSSKKMKAYTCQQCLSAKENRELFCFCRTEYDESQ